MDLHTQIRSELANNIANLSVDLAIYKANFENEVYEHEATRKELARLQSVLDNNEDLKSLFEEEMNKGEQ